MILLKNMTKIYGQNELATTVLKDINLEIKQGEFISIMGPSGSGKSTLLNILGVLDVPSSGDYSFLGTDIRSLSKNQLALFRRYMLGFVFQGFNLLKKSSAIENVEMPLLYLGVNANERKQRAIEALISVGLEDKIYYDPKKLSGGQQQRVAIARAIVTKPQLIIADEPTGNLDTKRGHEVMHLLKSFNDEGITIIMVTHEEEIAEYASRIIYLRDGVIEQEVKNAV
jgi:putative ABC transport system ATP-binding protein